MEMLRQRRRVKRPVFITEDEAAEAARIAAEVGCAIGSVLRLAVTRGLPRRGRRGAPRQGGRRVGTSGGAGSRPSSPDTAQLGL